MPTGGSRLTGERPGGAPLRQRGGWTGPAAARQDPPIGGNGLPATLRWAEGVERRWWSHAALSLVVLAASVLLVGHGQAYSSDEGAAILQAEVLSATGGWPLPPHLPHLDPHAMAQPFQQADAGPAGRFAYAKHPAYPLALQAVRAVAGTLGLSVVTLLAVWAAALLASRLAALVDPAAAAVTLWVVAAASPLAVTGHFVLAHAPAAAAVALAALAAVRGGARPLPWAAVAFVATASGCALRSESLLAAAALVVGLAAARPAAWPGLAAAVAGGAATARLAERVAVERITGGATAPVPATGEALLAGRLEAFRASWLETSYSDRPVAALLLIGAALALGAVVLERRDGARPVVVALGGCVVACALVWLAGGPRLVPGLLPAFPLLAALAALGAPAWRNRTVRLLAVTVAAGAAAILATQYSFGGGVEWGGRFYAVLVPLAAPLVGLGLRRCSRPVSLALLASGLLLTAGGWWAVADGHGRAERIGRDLASATRGRPHQPVVFTTDRLVPQLLWPIYGDHRWFTPERVHASCALGALRRGGERELVLLTLDPDGLSREAEAAGYRWEAVPRTGPLAVRRLRLDPAAPPAPCEHLRPDPG